MNYTHHDDELGLYTVEEEADFDHIGQVEGLNQPGHEFNSPCTVSWR